jgi:hypothetical protein
MVVMLNATTNKNLREVKREVKDASGAICVTYNYNDAQYAVRV